MNTISSPWELNKIDSQLIDFALIEDLGYPYRDLTTSLLFEKTEKICHARILSKHPEPIIFCGTPILNAVLAKFDFNGNLQCHYEEGQQALPGATLMSLSGNPLTLLMAERILLNFLQHMCAVATLTSQFVDRIRLTHTRVLDTRKTLPGFRHLDKYAVHCGGGVNHRMGLYDAIMVKDTHIDALGGIGNALKNLPKLDKSIPVIIEVRTMDELKIVLSQGLDKISRILLDNMSLDQLKACVVLCKNKIPTEASGNITLETVSAVANSGVDFVSIGKMTHSPPHIDLSMKCEF